MLVGKHQKTVGSKVVAWLGVILFAVPMFAQQATPEFELADVHARPRGAYPPMSGGMMGGGRYELHSATMVDLIRLAWGVDADKVVGGPTWLETDRFEVIAKAPANTPSDAMPVMLQKLLADRFGLLVHADKKPLPAFVLSLGKNLQLKATDGKGDSGCESRQNSRAPSPSAAQDVTIVCHNMLIADFAARMRGMSAAPLPYPVIDETGLKGTWDFTFSPTPPPGVSVGIAFIDSINKQLGLKLEQQNVPMPVIVVDKVNQTPTPNAPGVTQNLPPAPTQFEVAVVKPSAAGEAQGGAGFQPGGRLDLRAFPLKNLIMIAWAVSDDRIVDAPKWISSQRFDIVAKASSNPQPEWAVGLPYDIDAMRIMLRALLVNRFKLASHNEERPLPVYALIEAKSRLKKADPSNRAGCKQGGGRADPNTPFVFTYTCQGTTMQELAVKLRQMIGSEEIDHPVVDATGLDGAWDFEFTWSPPFQAPGGRDSVAASDPSGGMSLKEALNKQLGLKLELQNRPLPVLVIDHVDEKPTDN
jgi:uncharacterized protein (TIGR03435 family)